MNGDPGAKIRIGTCAWSYDDWRGIFYPEDLPPPQRLEFYARHFAAVEIDSTFYSAPAPQVAGHWLDATPEEFVFTAKTPRDITHEHKLRNCAQLMSEFLASVAPLRRKLACILVQLPPFFTLRHDEQALREFVLALPRDFRFAIEFRDPGWNLPRIVHLFEEHDICWVWHDITPIERADEAAFSFLPRTTDFVYVRLLGDFEQRDLPATDPSVEKRLAWPRDSSIETWAVKIKQDLENVAQAFLFASNHFEGFGPLTAQRIAAHFGMTVTLPVFSESGAEKQQLDLL